MRNSWLLDEQGIPNPPKLFPNIAESLPEETQRAIFQYMREKYIFPQVLERQAFEPTWDLMHRMYRCKLKLGDINAELGTRFTKEESKKDGVKVSDTVVHDAIERLCDIHHFVAFKEKVPVNYSTPDYVVRPNETDVYAPSENKVRAANALLIWNSENQSLNSKYRLAIHEFYKYGISFVNMDFIFKTGLVPVYDKALQRTVKVPAILDVGTSFEPISIRKIWMNWRLRYDKMDLQPCPFFFEEMSRIATLQNAYDPVSNPTGFLNLDRIRQQQWLYSEQEMQSAVNGLITSHSSQTKGFTIPNVLNPEHSVESLWTFYPMLPLDPETGEFDPDNGTIPMTRFVVQTFGSSMAGHQTILKIQENYYPHGHLPIACSAHMPDNDSGLYTPAIGEILEGYYREICTVVSQMITNKDWINDPPSWVATHSPAINQDLTKKGAKIEVLGGNDFGWREPFDATGSTGNILTGLREAAQTTSKAVDAIMGKAMGSRVSATEASNAFQAAMSGITTPINVFNSDMMRAYAIRNWLYFTQWVDRDLVLTLTGIQDFDETIDEAVLNFSIQTNIGSDFVETVTKVNNVRYILESSFGDPSVNRGELWKELFRLWKFNGKKIVNDGGLEKEVAKATDQTIQTYLGQPVAISPDQNHEIGIRVKMGFIEDRESYWNRTYPEMLPAIIEQIELHQKFLLLQIQLQEAQIEEQMQREERANQREGKQENGNSEE